MIWPDPEVSVGMNFPGHDDRDAHGVGFAIKIDIFLFVDQGLLPDAQKGGFEGRRHKQRISNSFRILEALTVRLVPSALAIRKQADVQYFSPNEGCEVDCLTVGAAARLDFCHRGSVSGPRDSCFL